MRILGIDPGLATGTAIYDLETCTFVRMDELPKGIHGFTEPYKALTGDTLGVTYVAAEKFSLRKDNKFLADLHGVEILGWLLGECQIIKAHCPEPVQHMTLTRLRKKADKGKVSPVTTLMKSQGFKIGKGHSRMAGSVAMWYAARVLNHRPTLELLKPNDS